MNKLMLVFAVGIALVATLADARSIHRCGQLWQSCCPGRVPCHGRSVCLRGRCRNGVGHVGAGGPVGPVRPFGPRPVGPFAPQQPFGQRPIGQFGPQQPFGQRPIGQFGPHQQFGFPGRVGFGFPLGPTGSAAINGGGLSQIAAGSSHTKGSGNTLASGGLSAVNGLSNTAVQGFGPAAGQVTIGGNANTQNLFGPLTGATGTGATGFLAGGGPTAGLANSNLNAFSNPLASGGGVNTHTGASSLGGAGSFGRVGHSATHG